MENNKDIEKALLKKAMGFTHNEIIKEYAIGEEGEIKLVKKKVTKKFSPPDIPAMKLLLDVYGNEKPISEMTDEELKAEKNRLLKELENIKEEDEESGD